MKKILIIVLLLFFIGCAPNLQPKVTELESQIVTLNVQITVRQSESETMKAQVKESLRLSALERAKGTCPEFRNFRDIYELREFLKNDKTNLIQYVPKDFDCEEFALMLQSNAFKKGFYIYLYSVDKDLHLMNGAIVGEKPTMMFYSIEPQNDEIKAISYVD